MLAPNIDFLLYFRGAGATNLRNPLNLLNPEYLRDVSAALDTLPLASWKAYMTWRALEALAPMLPSRFEQEVFHFNGEILSGQKEMRPRWMRCSDAVAGQPGADSLGDLVGKIFIQQRFGPDAKARMDELITALQRSLRERLTEVDWMSAETRAHALEKLTALNRKIGGPETWRDFSAVTIRRNDYAGNAMRISIDDTQRQLRWIGHPVDRTLWLMTPQTVNAFYAPQLNEVAFPAGILQPPVDGFTQDQRFFIAYAQIWCENATDQDFRRRAQEDVHAPGRWRANGVLQNMPEFRKAFGCREGTPMAPVNVCRVW